MKSKASPFIVLALPRSRTAWMAHWLSYPGKRVGHDIAIECKSVSQFLQSYSNGMDGTIETGAMLGWRLLKHEIPNLTTLVVMRKPDDVIQSLARNGLFGQQIEEEIWSRYHMLAGIVQCEDVKHLFWEELDQKEARKKVFELLLEIEFDDEWDERFAMTNIQIDFGARMEQLMRNHERIAAFKNEIVQKQQKIGLGSCPIFN